MMRYVRKYFYTKIYYSQVIKELKTVGYNGFLIAENFMKTDNPVQAISDFVAQVK